MSNFIGEYECKADAKGRIVLPAALKKQVSPEAQERFVVNRGFDKHLVMYPKNEWVKISAQVNSLNMYVKKNLEFARRFHNGATELELDGANRLLLPRRLMEYAALDKEIILFAFANRIEIWDKAAYEQMMNDDQTDFGSLAEEVMGGSAAGNSTNSASIDELS